MRQLPILILWAILPLLVGCWSGHRMAVNEVVYKHDAVRWIYSSGGQLGSAFLVPTVVRNRVYEIAISGGKVIVKEGGPGCITWAPWNLTTCLNIETGLPAFSLGAAPLSTNHVKTDWHDTEQTFVANVGHGLELSLPLPTSEIYIRRTARTEGDSIRLVALRHPRSFGASLSAEWFHPEVLVVGTFEGQVFCVDVNRIPGL